MPEFTIEQIYTAFDVAIASNSKDAMLWVAKHPLATAKHLDAIASKGKKISLVLKSIIARHENLDCKSCEYFRDSDSIELACAIISNKNLDLEYRRTWLTEKVIHSAMRAFENTKPEKDINSWKSRWQTRYWKKKLDSFRVKLPEDVWPDFENLIAVRDIIL